MISNRPMIPMLTHVDNLGDINLDMTSQEQSLERIANDTNSIRQSANDIERYDNAIKNEVVVFSPNIAKIKNSAAGIETTVGTTADADTATTVIGLLKSIANKLS